jgi:hypothetical protein
MRLPVASHYYSITRLATRGKLTVGGRTLEVTGTSWFDREFSTSQLAPDQVGWDWFSLQLSDGSDLMLYVMRLKDGSLDPASSGTLVDPQGRARHLKWAILTSRPRVAGNPPTPRPPTPRAGESASPGKGTISPCNPPWPTRNCAPAAVLPLSIGRVR